MMPEVAQGVGVYFVDAAAPWLATVGGTPGSTRYAPAAVARVRLRYDEEKADLVVDEEYEAVLHPLTGAADPAAAVAVDYDERDLLPAAPGPASFVLPDAPIKAKTFWSTLEKDLVSQLVRARTIEIFANRQLKLFSRAGETKDDFAARCKEAAAAKADEETAKLRDKYETKATSLQDKLQAAQDRARGARRPRRPDASRRSCSRPRAASSAASSAAASAAAAWPPSCGARPDGAPARVPPASASTPRRARRGASRPSSASWRPTCRTTSSASPVRGTRRRPPSTRCR